MYLEQLAKHLELSGLGKRGEDIFCYSGPSDLETYILFMFGGDGIPFDNELKGFYNTKYQVIVRSPSYDEGFALANKVKDALTFYDKTVDGIFFKQSLPKDEPRPYRRNEASIIEFANNFLISFSKE